MGCRRHPSDGLAAYLTILIVLWLAGMAALVLAIDASGIRSGAIVRRYFAGDRPPTTPFAGLEGPRAIAFGGVSFLFVTFA